MRWAMVLVLACGCHRGHQVTAPTSGSEAREAFMRCMFDAPPAVHDGAAMEAAVRRALREDRMQFSVRAGRCELVIEPVHEATTQTFAQAWNELLPLAQATAPDDIALEQAIRHVGNAYRGW